MPRSSISGAISARRVLEQPRITTVLVEIRRSSSASGASFAAFISPMPECTPSARAS